MNYIKTMLLISVFFGSAALYAVEGDIKKRAYGAQITCNSPQAVDHDFHFLPKEVTTIEKCLYAEPDLQDVQFKRLRLYLAVGLAGKAGLQSHIDQYVIEMFEKYTTPQLHISKLTLYRLALKITDRLLEQMPQPTEKE